MEPRETADRGSGGVQVWKLSDVARVTAAATGNFHWEYLASSQNFTAAVVHARGGEDPAAPGDHVHDFQDTFDVILDGSAELEVGGEVVKLSAGDAIYIPAGVAHGIRGDGSMTLLSIYMPAAGNGDAPDRRRV